MPANINNIMKTKWSGSLQILGCASILLLFSQPMRAADWYRWRGPDLNGISTETGWQTKWPDEGPKQLWKLSVGTGFSSMSVSHGRVYTAGNKDDQDTIYCLDADKGSIIWKHSYPCVLDPHMYEGGPSATPTVDGDRVYMLSRKGDLLCLKAATGEVVWQKNVNTGEPNAEIPTWGFASSPLVEGSLVIINVGDAGTAFDKMTGKLAWSSGKGASGYATPVPLDSNHDNVITIFAAKSLEAVNAADGKSVWSFPWKTSYGMNCTDPIISGQEVFISSDAGQGAARLRITGGKPSVIWQNKNLRTHINSCILWQGYVYGVDDTDQHTSELKCISWETGETKWSEPKFGKGSLMLAAGKIIGLSDKGELYVIDPTPGGFKPISHAQVLGGKCWTTPVLSNGKIYCRNAKGDLVCLDVSAGKTAAQ